MHHGAFGRKLHAIRAHSVHDLHTGATLAEFAQVFDGRLDLDLEIGVRLVVKTLFAFHRDGQFVLLNLLHDFLANAVNSCVQVTQELMEELGVLLEAIVGNSVLELADSWVFMVQSG